MTGCGVLGTSFFGNRSSFFEFWSEVLDSWLLDMCMVYYNEFMFVRGFS